MSTVHIRCSILIGFLIGLALIPGSERVRAEPAAVTVEIGAVGNSIHYRDELYARSAASQGQNYPADPTADIPWSCGTSDAIDIECAFNAARNAENNQLGTSLSPLTLPEQGVWAAMDDGQKALWLIDRERVDRGIAPLHGLEDNVNSVAQSYAQFLMDNDAFGHYEDGTDPWQRLDANPAIAGCRDFLSVAENLAIFWTSGSSIPLPIERSIFMWMYDDSSSSWGHRHAILWYPYNDNSGPAGKEGFLGIGRASGPHDGWNYSELIVMNVFDPCATWTYPPLDRKALPWVQLLLLND
ncbi:MAG: CAP domain-containing protein [bacterium]|nr:CAP domain-containing protein [bacterium]